ILNQWSSYRKLSCIIIAKIAVAFESLPLRKRARPVVADFLGDNGVNITERVCSVQSGGWRPNNCNPFDHCLRRYVVELVATKVVWVDVSHVVLAFAVDKNQGVVRTHTSNTNTALSGFVRCFSNIDALNSSYRIKQSYVGFFVELPLRDNSN